MTEIERKALALLNECAGQEVYGGWGTFDPNQSPCTRALCRAIEQHEAFRQEVSDAVANVVLGHGGQTLLRKHVECFLSRFIIAKPDPLVEILLEEYGHVSADADAFRAALAARGLKIVEVE